MNLLVVGIVLNTVVTLLAGASYGSVVMIIVGIPLAISYVGLALIAGGNRTLGAKLALGGSVLFVPLGMIAVMGARQVLDEVAREQFEADA